MKKRYYAFFGIVAFFVVGVIVSYQFFITSFPNADIQVFLTMTFKQAVGFFVLSGGYFGGFAIYDEFKKRKSISKRPIA